MQYQVLFLAIFNLFILITNSSSYIGKFSRQVRPLVRNEHKNNQDTLLVDSSNNQHQTDRRIIKAIREGNNNELLDQLAKAINNDFDEFSFGDSDTDTEDDSSDDGNDTTQDADHSVYSLLERALNFKQVLKEILASPSGNLISQEFVKAVLTCIEDPLYVLCAVSKKIAELSKNKENGDAKETLSSLILHTDDTDNTVSAFDSNGQMKRIPILLMETLVDWFSEHDEAQCVYNLNKDGKTVISCSKPQNQLLVYLLTKRCWEEGMADMLIPLVQSHILILKYSIRINFLVAKGKKLTKRLEVLQAMCNECNGFILDNTFCDLLSEPKYERDKIKSPVMVLMPIPMFEFLWPQLKDKQTVLNDIVRKELWVHFSEAIRWIVQEYNPINQTDIEIKEFKSYHGIYPKLVNLPNEIVTNWTGIIEYLLVNIRTNPKSNTDIKLGRVNALTTIINYLPSPALIKTISVLVGDLTLNQLEFLINELLEKQNDVHDLRIVQELLLDTLIKQDKICIDTMIKIVNLVISKCSSKSHMTNVIAKLMESCTGRSYGEEKQDNKDCHDYHLSEQMTEYPSISLGSYWPVVEHLLYNVLTPEQAIECITQFEKTHVKHIARWFFSLIDKAIDVLLFRTLFAYYAHSVPISTLRLYFHKTASTLDKDEGEFNMEKGEDAGWLHTFHVLIQRGTNWHKLCTIAKYVEPSHTTTLVIKLIEQSMKKKKLYSQLVPILRVIMKRWPKLRQNEANSSILLLCSVIKTERHALIRFLWNSFSPRARVIEENVLEEVFQCRNPNIKRLVLRMFDDQSNPKKRQ